MTGQLHELGRLEAVPPDLDLRLTVAAVVRSVSVATMRLHMGHMDGTVVIIMVVISTDRNASE